MDSIVVKKEPVWDYFQNDAHNESSMPTMEDETAEEKQKTKEEEEDDDMCRELESFFDGTAIKEEDLEETKVKLENEPPSTKEKKRPKPKKKPLEQIKHEKEEASINRKEIAHMGRSSASKLGTMELRRMARSIHKKKEVVVKNFRIDATKEKSKQEFLRQLKTLLVSENVKLTNAYQALTVLQDSVFSEKIQAELSQKASNPLASKDLNRVIAQQEELDKRQRVLAKEFELMNEYLDKLSKQSEKSMSASLQARRKLTDVINDMLKVVNHDILDRQVIENMYISAQHTRQDIYQSNTHSPVAISAPLFRNYRTGQHSMSIEHELKKTVKARSKKEEYMKKSEKY
jgi:hypothetical protein